MAFTTLKPSNIFCLLILFLVLHSPTSCKAYNILYSGEFLNSGQSLRHGRSYSLVMQNDCNLVLYDDTRNVWASRTANRAQNCRCTMRNDGVLAILNPAGSIIWRSNVAGRTGSYVLILQKDRNLVIYGPGVWATNTHVRPASDAAPVVAVANNSDSEGGASAKFTPLPN